MWPKFHENPFKYSNVQIDETCGKDLNFGTFLKSHCVKFNNITIFPQYMRRSIKIKEKIPVFFNKL